MNKSKTPTAFIAEVRLWCFCRFKVSCSYYRQNQRPGQYRRKPEIAAERKRLYDSKYKTLLQTLTVNVKEKTFKAILTSREPLNISKTVKMHYELRQETERQKDEQIKIQKQIKRKDRKMKRQKILKDQLFLDHCDPSGMTLIKYNMHIHKVSR